jgi:uncharacterized membrane protein
MECWRQGVASLFEDSDPRARAGRNALLLLALIVVAGAVTRFWGLGNVGLHGDEKTMVLPALHLLRYGTPDMPSGFLYPRALAQLYFMAESVRVFGLSEWAWRFPSAVCGVLLIVLTWTAGRRFLEPRWNLALTAAVAFLPMLIVDAQTARMYVFLVTGVTGFMGLLFAWERTGHSGYLVAAVIEMAVSLQFHTLSIFAAWLCFLPGLASGDRRRLRLGTAAFAVIAVEYLALNRWISAEYPHQIADSIAAAVTNAPRAAHAPPLQLSWPLLAALPAVALSWLAIRARGVLPVVLLAASLVAQVSRLYHVAILLFVAAMVLARRDGKLPAGRLGIYLGVCVLLAAAQVGFLWEHRAGTLPQILGLLLGWPSIRPFIALSHFSQVAMGVAGCGVAGGLWQLAHRRPVPDHVLLFCLGVWLPLLQIGYLRWDIPPRYAEAQVMPLLIAAFASARWAATWLASRMSERRSPTASASLWGAVAAGVFLLLIIDPLRLEAAVDPSYAHYPDHRGAARFVASLHPKPDDVIVAEDTLMQTYYLGHVDYWLMNKEVAAEFMHEVDGRWLDEYTNAPLIGTGRQLQHLVDSRDRGAIYVIGSGENQQDGRQIMRGLGIAQELESPAFHLIYVGSDGVTDVWKVDPPKRPLTAGR